MKVSIITIAYNSASTIEDTIRSVIAQTHPDIEYIIIDGGSNDGTLDILERYKNKIQKIISEKDNGIYDAMNKGVLAATGNIIGILNSDDYYADNNVLRDVTGIFEKENCDGLYADLEYVDRENVDRIVRRWKAGHYYPGKFRQGWMPPHPTFFARKQCYDQFGHYNLALKSAADYELMLRFIHKHGIRLSYLERVITKMRVGGQSNVSLRNRIKANAEDRAAWRLNGLRPAWYTLTWKPLSKLFQFLKR